MPDEFAENWKEKYRSSLDRLERRQRELEEIDTLMRDGIARLSVVAEGQDRNLDEQLRRLRKAVRGRQDTATVRRLLESVSSLARSLDEDPGAKGDSVAARKVVLDPGSLTGAGGAASATVGNRGALLKSADMDMAESRQVLSAMLGELRLPGPHAARIKELSAELTRATFDEEMHTFGREIAAIVNRALAGSAAQSGRAESSPATGELLIQLLNCIAVPPEFGPRMEAIKARLTVGPAVEEWPAVLQSIAELIADMRARIEAEKSELENFLVQLTDRLRDLDEHLHSAQSAHQASYQGGRQLERRMQDEMGQIESGVRQASSLDQLKGLVRNRLEVIRVHLDEHRRSEAQRQAELEQQLEHMTTRLRSVEQETTHLRAHLRKRKIQAMSDPLTGIANRTAFEERLQREHGRWKRYRHSLGFMILDVDHFKQINDNYGHKAGDRALKLIAQLLRQSLRETDFIARYGGEEFVALLPETGQAQIAEVAEKLRRVIETCSFHHRGVRVPITISAGYCEFRGEDSSEDVFQRADAALYRAKAQGRNRCCGGESAEPPQPAGPADRR